MCKLNILNIFMIVIRLSFGLITSLRYGRCFEPSNVVHPHDKGLISCCHSTDAIKLPKLDTYIINI